MNSTLTLFMKVSLFCSSVAFLFMIHLETIPNCSVLHVYFMINEAGCTYSVDAVAWMLACSIVISVCGLIMIMLRSSYYPEQYLGMSEEWITKQIPTKSASFESQSSSKSIIDTKTPKTMPITSPSTEIRGSEQSPQDRGNSLPSTPPRVLFEFDLESVECSPDRLPQQTSPPRPSRNSFEI